MHPGRPKNIHVVIVNYNSSKDAITCVLSLARNASVRSITVLDNASRDDERESLSANLRDPLVRLIFLQENVGFGAGVNRAIATLDADDCDAVWIVNPDVVVEETTGDRLLAGLESFDLVSPVIYSGQSGAEFLWYGGGDIDVRRGLTATWNEDRINHLEAPTAVTFVTGACPMIRLGAWRRSGGFREDLFLYWEDSEICIRLMAGGSRLAVVPEARVWHRVGGSGELSGKSKNYYYYMNRNRLWVCGQHASKAQILAGIGARYTARLLVSAAREPRARYGKIWASLRGIAHGLSKSPMTAGID